MKIKSMNSKIREIIYSDNQKTLKYEDDFQILVLTDARYTVIPHVKQTSIPNY